MTGSTPTASLLLRSTDPADVSRMGGKAAALATLVAAELPVPEFLVLGPGAFDASLSEEQRAGLASAATFREFDEVLRGLTLRSDLLDQVLAEIARWEPDGREGDGTYAVRSSGVDEDGSGHTFAGQFDSYLFVRPGDLASRITAVWRSGFGERVLAYRSEHDLAAATAPAVLIQRMVDAEVSGVAFSADPVTGQRGVTVVSAVYGLGTALVGGDVDADTYRVGPDGAIRERTIAKKLSAHRAAPGTETGVEETPVEPSLSSAAALRDEQILAVAELARRAESGFGRPQDIEWAIRDGKLSLLQSRPITSLRRVPDPDGVRNLWDNSNIVESYSGITTPLTFTFALGAYEGVYREFCRILGVPAAKIEANGGTFARMLGLIQGRVYYNLLNWYRVLALLPGFTVNRAFMENMMGVREGLPDEVAAELAAGGVSRFRDRIDLLRAVVGLIANHWKLAQKTRAFYERLNEALAPPEPPLGRMRIDQLVAEYRRLEGRLLTRWDAPLINDFFAMIHFGVLGRLTSRWCGDENGTLQNDLVASQGGMISAEPAHRIREMAALVHGLGPERADRLGERLREGRLAEARHAIKDSPDLEEKYEEYLARFGDRCLDELKLESTTLEDDPLPLLRAIGNTAAGLAREASTTGEREPNASPSPELLPQAAEAQVARALGRNPLRRIVFGWVLKNARDRVRDRENLRFERTRLFGRVRRIFLEVGRRLWAEGRLEDPRDVFFLELAEILGFVEGTATSDDLASVARVRRTRFAEYAKEPKPADRFETRGAVYIANDYAGSETIVPRGDGTGPSGSSGEGRDSEPAAESDPDVLLGLGCCPGIVRGRVRVVHDPRGAVLEDGEILVAERTDPGWILLFPSASAILVERGSLLSHSAIVAREMGIPAIVSIPRVTERLETGDQIEMNGSTGRVRRLRAEPERPTAGPERPTAGPERTEA